MLNEIFEIIETPKSKSLRSADYNWEFDKETGLFIRTGKDIYDDPEFSPFGPEIADIEIAAGRCSSNCKYCYKNNGSGEKSYMPLDKFKYILGKIGRTLTQIAFGITDIYENPDFFDILRTTREYGIIPNYTTSGKDLDDVATRQTVAYCGAVAVSYTDYDICFDAIERFSSAGMRYVNMHFLLAEETYDKAFEVLQAIKNDPRARGLHAIVFLCYKPKGRNPGIFTPVKSIHSYKRLVDQCDGLGINYGFDSCSAPMLLKIYPGYRTMIEPCEAGLFSIYINCRGDAFPCSFLENTTNFHYRISLLEEENFVDKIWNGAPFSNWRNKLLQTSATCRLCPVYDIYGTDISK